VGDITGKRLVTIDGSRTSGPGLSDTSEGGIYQVEQIAFIGAWALGVAKHDALDGELVGVIASPGIVVPVTAGAAISAGAEVCSDALGRVIPIEDTLVAAARSVGVVANNNAITFTAKEAGADGNGIRVGLIDPAGNDQALAVDVDGGDIIVSLATGSGGAITSTAADVIAAIAEHDEASQKIAAANNGASSGAGVATASALTALAGGEDKGVAVGRVLTDASGIGADAETKLY